MRTLNPGQPLSEVRFIDGDDSLLIEFGPGTATSSLTNTPSNYDWTPPV